MLHRHSVFCWPVLSSLETKALTTKVDEVSLEILQIELEMPRLLDLCWSDEGKGQDQLYLLVLVSTLRLELASGRQWPTNVLSRLL